MEEKKLLVRPMSEKDLSDVLEIEKQGFISPWTESQFLYELNENPVATLMVLTYGEKVIGFVDFWITFDSACINQIAVIKELRGHKLGKLLMIDTIARIEGVEEVKAITLEVRVHNDVAINFYLSFDFDIVLTKKQYYDNGDDAYYMMKVVKE